MSDLSGRGPSCKHPDHDLGGDFCRGGCAPRTRGVVTEPGRGSSSEPPLTCAHGRAWSLCPDCGSVGRCGQEAPRIVGGVLTFCRLPHGHAGWHKGDDGSEWNEITGRATAPARTRS